MFEHILRVVDPRSQGATHDHDQMDEVADRVGIVPVTENATHLYETWLGISSERLLMKELNGGSLPEIAIGRVPRSETTPARNRATKIESSNRQRAAGAARALAAYAAVSEGRADSATRRRPCCRTCSRT